MRQSLKNVKGSQALPDQMGIPAATAGLSAGSSRRPRLRGEQVTCNVLSPSPDLECRNKGNCYPSNVPLKLIRVRDGIFTKLTLKIQMKVSESPFVEDDLKKEL